MTEDEILKRYGRRGILTHLPTKHEARMEVLAWVASPIRPGVTYRESEINDLLRGHGIDHVTLRRYLVDYGFLTREGGIYQVAAQPPWPPQAQQAAPLKQGHCCGRPGQVCVLPWATGFGAA